MMTLDENIAKLASERSDNINGVLSEIGESDIIALAVVKALGSTVFLSLSKDSIHQLQLICALCYLLGRDRAQTEMLENSVE